MTDKRLSGQTAALSEAKLRNAEIAICGIGAWLRTPVFFLEEEL